MGSLDGKYGRKADSIVGAVMETDLNYNWNCRDLGHDCDGNVTGDFYREIVDEMSKHSIEVYPPDLAEVRYQEFLNRLNSALRSSSGPPNA